MNYKKTKKLIEKTICECDFIQEEKFQTNNGIRIQNKCTNILLINAEREITTHFNVDLGYAGWLEWYYYEDGGICERTDVQIKTVDDLLLMVGISKCDEANREEKLIKKTKKKIRKAIKKAVKKSDLMACYSLLEVAADIVAKQKIGGEFLEEAILEILYLER